MKRIIMMVLRKNKLIAVRTKNEENNINGI